MFGREGMIGLDIIMEEKEAEICLLYCLVFSSSAYENTQHIKVSTHDVRYGANVP